MSIKVKTKECEVTISDLPDQCPKCKKHLVPEVLYGYMYEKEENQKNKYILEVFFSCTNKKCKSSFIGQYLFTTSQNGSTNKFIKIISNENYKKQRFSDNIDRISQNFIGIYNESYLAEQQKLFEICGIGYRKALEYLIKDYLIKYKKIDKSIIEKKHLGNCISDHIEDVKIKTVAKRAAWIGNDEAHYVRKWEDRDFTDLKTLISLTVHWIEMEIISKDYEESMPD